ncbi:hypothetical protein BJX70DRAFT_391506 [Aspergillus crustosus]
MNALLITTFGPPSVLKLTTQPTPTPQDDEVLIKIAAFGLNHAELHMRKGEWAEWMPISGIECVGIIASSPQFPSSSSSGSGSGTELSIGTPVASLMGGLGRTTNGTYAEYTVAKTSNVVPLGPSAKNLSWAQLGVLPEGYATAWTVLFRNLEVREGQRLLVRGGTSAFGRAAINLAVAKGVRVFATTRNQKRVAGLKELGVEEVFIEDLVLSKKFFPQNEKFDAVLELIGNSTIVDSLTLVHRGGRVCLAGFLGGLSPIPDFNPLLQMASGVHFSFFGSFVFGTPGFPLADVPLQEIVGLVAERKFQAEPARVWGFGEEGVQQAHEVMERSEAGGKMVVVVDEGLAK